MSVSDQQQAQSSSFIWTCPELASEPSLRLLNSLTGQKVKGVVIFSVNLFDSFQEVFVPMRGNEIRWFSSPPTPNRSGELDVRHAR